MKDLTVYIESLLDEPNTKVKLVEGVYRVNVDLTSSNPTSIDTLAFKQIKCSDANEHDILSKSRKLTYLFINNPHYERVIRSFQHRYSKKW
jgi:hypothetical protein